MRRPRGIPYAVKNLLGWTITGPFNQKSNSSGLNSHSTNFIDPNDQKDANLTELVKKNLKSGRISHPRTSKSYIIGQKQTITKCYGKQQ